LPYPKQKVKIELSLRQKNGENKIYFSHFVNPDDILIQKMDTGKKTPCTILQHGKPEKCIDVAILAEGFTQDEMPVFRKFAQAAIQQLFLHQPFDKYEDFFNFYIVETVSENSGVSIPHDGLWKKTAFNSHFDTFYSKRYLTTSNVKKVHDALIGIPYEHIIILANTDVYGGGGIYNAFTLTSTGHPDFYPVVVHEFGHSFAGLADEYFYENDALNDSYNFQTEPWEQNITTLVDFDAKWKDILLPNTPIPTQISDSLKFKIGVYEGAAYSGKGIYRASANCRMKTNRCKTFCMVCQQAIEKLILFYLGKSNVND
jgi:hypothetical protein